MSIQTELQTTIEELVQKGKGILAADESNPTIAKRFKPIATEPTEENRRTWRNLLLSTTGLGDYISGVILFEETLTQRSDEGVLLPQMAQERGYRCGYQGRQRYNSAGQCTGRLDHPGPGWSGRPFEGLQRAGGALCQVA